MRDFIDVVFDGPPEHEAGCFVEVEDQNGSSIHAGEWVKRPDGYWALRLTTSAFEEPEPREPDSECYRGGEYTSALAHEQAQAQRLK